MAAVCCEAAVRGKERLKEPSQRTCMHLEDAIEEHIHSSSCQCTHERNAVVEGRQRFDNKDTFNEVRKWGYPWVNPIRKESM